MSKIARIVYFSARLDTYVDSIIALLVQKPEIEIIEMVFTTWSYPEQDTPIVPPEVGEEQEDFLYKKVRTKLIEVGKEIEVYQKAKNVELRPKQLKGHFPKLFDECNVIDVSALPKEFAINILSVALMKKNIEVYSLRWGGKLRKDRTNRISVDNYIYEDLTSMQETKSLRSSYLSNKIFIYCIGVSIFALGLLSSLSYWLPSFKVATHILNSFGLLIGAASLYLATRKSS